MADKPHYHGHRERLRQRFMQAGGDALPDYELMELVLCLAIPRGDVKPVAKALLARFGGFANVIAAEPQALQEVKGLGEASIAALKVVQAAAARLARDEVKARSVLGSWDKVLAYLKTAMGRETTEQFRVLFLDAKNGLIADEKQQTGTVNHTPVYPREVVKRALELSASAIILVHNHPSGDPTPSRADIDMTREVADAAAKLDIALHDHVIIARNGHVSLRSEGLI